jgi:LytS/YehU family sensor histidine kinase
MEETATFLFFILFVIFLILFIRSNNQVNKIKTENAHLRKQVLNLKELIAEQDSKMLWMAKEIERLEIENLRFVLNPHSFRNTLNSIQNLANRTQKSVLGLSAIMDFMLYDSLQPVVSLDKELDFLKQYVDLYVLQLRAGIRKELKTDLAEFSGFAERHLIAPMITASFVENAFKHGDMDSDDSFIVVQISVVDMHSIVFSVRNKMKSTKTSGPSGLGLQTLTKRLNKLYPGKFHLENSASNGTYLAALKLELHEKDAVVHPH